MQPRKMHGAIAALLAGFSISSVQALPAGVTWDWQLQSPLDLQRSVDVLALDPDEVNAADIAALTSRGIFTICYVSVGTVENWRADAGDFSPDVIGNTYGGWPGERFLDIRDPGVLSVMSARFMRCAELGFDAIEPDNMDLHINDTGFEITANNVVNYVRELATMAHGLGMEIAQKNTGDLTPQLSPMLDFAIAENCMADGWCSALLPYLQARRAVLAAEYQGGPVPTCEIAAAMGLSLIFKTRDLDRNGSSCIDWR